MVDTTGRRPLNHGLHLRRGFWRHPRQVWFRRALFQVHLWAGIILLLYTVLIGVSGSILVFEDELARWSDPGLMQAHGGSTGEVTGATLKHVSEEVQRAYPGWRPGSIYSPGVRGHNYAAIVSREGKYQTVFASASDLRLLGAQPLDKGWLNWVADLHFRLLAGSTGLIINGIGAAGLVLVCISGAVIWWPGVKGWKRALVVDLGRRWKRVNFDLHSAVGFWTLGIMSFWGVSGMYFVWPEAFVSAVNLISKSANASPPKLQFKGKHVLAGEVRVESLINVARALAPAAKLQGFNYAAGNQPFSVMLARDDPAEFLHTTWVYLDPASSKVLGVWRSGRNETIGDWFIWSMAPLHFGTYWGLGVKVIWAILGLMLPLLGITGLLMYWNRFLSAKWRALTRRTPPTYRGDSPVSAT